jgi:repressor LexA
MSQLTKAQTKIWNFLITYYSSEGHIPDYQLIQEEFGFKHHNSVYQYFQALVKKGFLKKDGQGSFKIHPSKEYYLEEQTRNSIPILGQIAASGMQEAIEEPLGLIPVILTGKRPSKLFSLQVVGPSMSSAGIYDKDYVLLERKPELNNGEIGAIRYQGETTLKRYWRENNQIRLAPENKHFDPIVISPGEFEQVTVIGRYVGKAHTDGNQWHITIQR